MHSVLHSSGTHKWKEPMGNGNEGVELVLLCNMVNKAERIVVVLLFIE